MKQRQHRTQKKKPPQEKKEGALIIIGGAEDKSGEMEILREVAARTDTGKLILVTAASQYAEDTWQRYCEVFKNLGVKSVEHLHIEQPEDARDPKLSSLFENASTVFFTGGDQLRITTKIGGTPIVEWIFEIYRTGGTIAGTSAGASIMGETMLVGEEIVESHKVGNWMMAPGLGLIENMLIDQHFAQRGRIGRLLGAVAMNPGILGIGIDENTAILIQGHSFAVIGQNAVYVIDGREVTYTNISEAAAERTMSMHDVKIHILSGKEQFDLTHRRPSLPQSAAAN